VNDKIGLGESLKNLIRNRKASYLLLIIGVLFAVAIISLPTEKLEDKTSEPQTIEEQPYDEVLSKQIEEMVSAITGENAPHVTVTLSTSGETVYATEDRVSERNSQEYSDSSLNKTLSDGDTEKTYIILKNSDGSQKPLIVTQKKPEIKGVVVISAYGNNTVIREKIMQAVKTALNLSSTQVCVTGQGEYT